MWIGRRAQPQSLEVESAWVASKLRHALARRAQLGCDAQPMNRTSWSQMRAIPCGKELHCASCTVVISSSFHRDGWPCRGKERLTGRTGGRVLQALCGQDMVRNLFEVTT